MATALSARDFSHFIRQEQKTLVDNPDKTLSVFREHIKNVFQNITQSPNQNIRSIKETSQEVYAKIEELISVCDEKIKNRPILYSFYSFYLTYRTITKIVFIASSVLFLGSLAVIIGGILSLFVTLPCLMMASCFFLSICIARSRLEIIDGHLPFEEYKEALKDLLKIEKQLLELIQSLEKEQPAEGKEQNTVLGFIRLCATTILKGIQIIEDNQEFIDILKEVLKQKTPK